MRRINPSRFQIATRGTSREINSRIVLNLVRTHQPISRADLARAMGVSRAAVTLIVNDLLERRLLSEGATGQTERGRRPTFLYINARRRSVVSVDIRASETFLMLADLMGKPLSGVISIPTVRDPKAPARGPGRPDQGAARRAPRSRIAARASASWCPAWSSTPACACCTRRRSAGATWICASRSPPPPASASRSRTPAAPARWPRCGRLGEPTTQPHRDLVFVSVSDGVGVGVVMNGEVLRGRHNVAGEFGHVPLSLDGPRCSCGNNGCWEAYVANPATLARYFGRPASPGPAGRPRPAVHRSRTWWPAPAAATRRRWRRIEATARYLGLGLASVINALEPGLRVHRRRDHDGVGPHRGRGPRRSGGARADAGRRGHGAPRRRRRPNTRACRAPPRWSSRRRSPRRSWPDGAQMAEGEGRRHAP